MTALHYTLLTALTIAGAAMANPTIAIEAEGGSVPVVADEVLIRPVASRHAEQIGELLADHGLDTPRAIGAGNWLLVAADAPNAERFQALLAELSSDDRVAAAAPNALMASDGGSLASGRFDPHRDLQWNLDLIDAEGAHAVAGYGSEDVVVAILDSGVAWRNAPDGSAVQHPDLVHTHFVAPVDFVDRDRYPDDELFHGTHVAGIIAAGAENGEGILGVAPNTAIMPVRVLDHEGIGTLANLVAGIDHAVEFGADVINLSLSFTPGYRPGAILAETVREAWEAGVVIVASTGNLGLRAIPFPAAYNEVIAVGSVGPETTLARYSNFGRGIDVVAPGGLRGEAESAVLSACIIDGDPTQVGYGWAAGTSQAAPHVAALAALLVSQGVSDPLAVRNLIEASAADFGREGWDLFSGAGLIDPIAALGADVPLLALDELEGWNPEPAVTRGELAVAVIEEIVLDLLSFELRNAGGLIGQLNNNGGFIGFLGGNGGYIGLMGGNGGYIGLMGGNGGLLGHLNNNGGLIGMINGNGGNIGHLNNNGGLIGHMDFNGGLLGQLNNNGALLGFIEQNGGLIGMINGNGGLLGLISSNGSELRPL